MKKKGQPISKLVDEIERGIYNELKVDGIEPQFVLNDLNFDIWTGLFTSKPEKKPVYLKDKSINTSY